MTAYNYFFKSNFQFTEEAKPSIDNVVTPGGFSLPVQTAAVNAGDISADLTAINAVAQITAEDKDLEIAAVVVFHNPTDADDEAFKILPLTKNIADFDFASPYSLTISFNDYETDVAARYQNSILYLAVITKNADSEIVQYSATYSLES